MITLKEAVLTVAGKQQRDLMLLRSYMAGECPTTLKALRLVDMEYTTVKQHKGYNLIKRDNKKLGFVYYVRYWYEGRMLPTKWCTHTNNEEAAREFAEQNRNTLISGYLIRRDGGAVRFFKQFYNARSTEYLSECKRNGKLSEERRKRYESVMINKFIVFLNEQRINRYDRITAHILDDFQDYLLAQGLKAQSVNDDMTAIHKAFRYLVRKGRIKENPCLLLCPVPERQDTISKLLNLLIYTTDMRNSEIKRFSKNDIVSIGGCRFIDLKDSKTENGVRLVPLHNRVYQKVMAHAKDMENTEPIFGNMSDYRFMGAYLDLGYILKVNNDFLKEKNITYYSGRHFWKTLMNAEGLGEDIEEIFMGHKISRDVAKLYNHRDAQGKKRLVKKAREVFAILDKTLFYRRK